VLLRGAGANQSFEKGQAVGDVGFIGSQILSLDTGLIDFFTDNRGQTEELFCGHVLELAIGKLFFDGGLAFDQTVQVLTAGGQELFIQVVEVEGANDVKGPAVLAIPFDEGGAANADFLRDAVKAPVLGASFL
jgi:hypothetical protein